MPGSAEIAGDAVGAAGGAAGEPERGTPSLPVIGAERKSLTVPAAAVPLRVVPPPRPWEPLRAVPPVLETPESPERWWQRFGSRQSRSFLTSLILHVVLLVTLGLIVLESPSGIDGPDLVATFGKPEPLDLPWDPTEPESERVEWTRIARDATEMPQAEQTPQIVLPEQEVRGEAPSSRSGVGFQAEHPANWAQPTAVRGGGLEGRQRDARARLVQEGGGNAASEEAVERGLRWLVAHQGRDGSWRFNHHEGPCQGLCRDPGESPSTTGATAMALLAFLGAGHTHIDGDYMTTVRDGLYYLGSRALVTSEGADLREGTMYAQGLATIALCEAYGLTSDPGLRDLAQQAIHFIVSAQDREGGGWRYTPGEPGDTTVSGWQIMALKSGQMARLSVPSPTLHAAGRFLDRVQNQDGALYGYMTPDPRPATTAIGLLCRMYCGWDRNHPALIQGVAYLSKRGPSQAEDSIYFNYYATQVLHHAGGSDWERWNAKMRDSLIATQAADGHEAGSWYFPGRHSRAGGRLYSTALAIMTLEVYYRYMPLYRYEAIR